MDTHLYIYGQDAKTLLADNNDESNENICSFLRYKFELSGYYYVMVKKYLSSSAGDFFISIKEDNGK